MYILDRGEAMLLVIVEAMIVGFMYKGLEVLVKKLFPKKLKYVVYIWAMCICCISIVYNESFVWKIPVHADSVLHLFIIVLLINCFISRQSGYYPIGKFDIFNFILVYPVFEEMSFRGLILPLLVQNRNLPGWIGVIASAFVFAVAHLQYYKLNRRSITFMLFAFSGGLFFGYIALITKSIVMTIPLHIAFNGSAVFYSRRIEGHFRNVGR